MCVHVKDLPLRVDRHSVIEHVECCGLSLSPTTERGKRWVGTLFLMSGFAADGVSTDGGNNHSWFT